MEFKQEIVEGENRISLDKAQQIADRMEAANAEAKEIIKKAEELKIEQVLSGQSVAGSVKVPVTKEQALQAGMKEYFKGTVIEKAIMDQEAEK